MSLKRSPVPDTERRHPPEKDALGRQTATPRRIQRQRDERGHRHADWVAFCADAAHSGHSTGKAPRPVRSGPGRMTLNSIPWQAVSGQLARAPMAIAHSHVRDNMRLRHHLYSMSNAGNCLG